MELKNQYTGQDVNNAVRQYREDRNPEEPIFRFNERSLVHFAVDLFECKMTTKLAGEKTYFLPFNQGSNGAGNVGGEGNPTNENGYTTDYLLKKVLNKDSLMEILQKFVHLQVKEEVSHRSGKEIIKRKENIIFPRYHQLDVVRKLISDVRNNGIGKNYLIQHSAGSGKSNSIAWLAHRLSGLHNSLD
jgi:type I restriction enzyme R subunit